MVDCQWAAKSGNDIQMGSRELTFKKHDGELPRMRLELVQKLLKQVSCMSCLKADTLIAVLQLGLISKCWLETTPSTFKLSSPSTRSMSASPVTVMLKTLNGADCGQ